MSRRLFGTDGVRGRVGVDLTAETAFRLGRASAGYFLERGPRRCVVARDTRLSGDAIGSAFMSGAASIGVEVVDLGIAPTPAVSALLSSVEGRQFPTLAFGAVISASHNPYDDNGIKLFSPDGTKLTTAEEDAIERRFRTGVELDASENLVGRIQKNPDLVRTYLDAVRARFPIQFARTRIVIDAAHGAWAPHVRALFDGIASDIVHLNDTFTGTDINAACGSTHVESLDPHLSVVGRQSSVVSAVGIAFDGDGDRCLIRVCVRSSDRPIVSPCRTLDGDGMLLLFARHLVPTGSVVGTVMSNGSLAAELEKMNRLFVRAPVGDREVFERMALEKSALGGEQSGHIIFGQSQKTGDGAVTALSFLKVLSEQYGESLDRLLADLPAPFPQKLVNVRVAEKRPWEDDPVLTDAIARAREILGKHGRLVIRYSGTEPLLRIMAEAPSSADVEEQVKFLVEKFSMSMKSL